MNLRLLPLLLALSLAGCQRKVSNRVQGYVEGEFVHVASPFAGQLETLAVQRGSQVKEGEPLFSLECALERAARDFAAKRLDEGRARLADAKKGLRQTEIDSLDAQLRQARAALAFSEKEFERQKGLAGTSVASLQELDRARAALEQEQQRVSRIEADLSTAKLGSREDQIAAAEANVHALDAALAQAEWNLSQKKQAAPQSGLVFDTLYREGEWVPAGRPVISLLPPANVKVRAFVPEEKVGTIRIGASARVHVDGIVDPFAGKVGFISPQAEYTPPVIYSEESRKKLVFMIEIQFDSAIAARLHPGQPVDVQF